jgi:polyhydroxyalkanoate synthesis repressor PhaR
MRFSRQPVRLIKKYPNRRLYDTTDSVYITLDELTSRVKGGADVRIVDASTGEDLTQQTLAQMLFDGRGAARFLSVSLLTQLVRLGDDALAEFMGRYVATALELYFQSRRGAQAISPLNPFATLPFAATEALARLLNGALSWPVGAQPFAPPGFALPPSSPLATSSDGGSIASQSSSALVPAVVRDPSDPSDPRGARPSRVEAREGDPAREIEALRDELAALRAQLRRAELRGEERRAREDEDGPRARNPVAMHQKKSPTSAGHRAKKRA